MSTKKRVITRRTLEPSQIDIDVWDEKTIEAFPITDRHIGTSVRYASSPRSKDYTLLEIKEPGEEYFSEGGYILEEKGVSYNLHVFLDEIIPFTKKKKVKKANSQLARKKTKKKKTKKKA